MLPARYFEAPLSKRTSRMRQKNVLINLSRTVSKFKRRVNSFPVLDRSRARSFLSYLAVNIKSRMRINECTEKREIFANDRCTRFLSVATRSWGSKWKAKKKRERERERGRGKTHFLFALRHVARGSDVLSWNLRLFGVFNLECIKNSATGKRIYPSNSMKKIRNITFCGVISMLSLCVYCDTRSWRASAWNIFARGWSRNNGAVKMYGINVKR